ncbi:MAG: glycoside hydrolase family 1 protein [Chloroflexi bacterium]|nr:MAG: glycoside hydrolase family 1 protein [Chloroflexota bacterium]
MGFPKGFLWGAGSAAHQVEGGNVGNDWWAWERNPESPCVEESKDACDQWNRYLTDLDLLAGLGLNTYRFSVEWSRIEPRQGQISKCALDHYRHLCEAARRRGVEPVVVFQHFTLPLWVAANGGWSDRATVTHFERFCETVAGHLAGAFGYACTINEPNVVAAFGYEVGIFPPGERSLARKESVSELLVAAHLAGAHVIRSAAPGVKVGLALAMHEYAGEPGYEEQLSQMRRRRRETTSSESRPIRACTSVRTDYMDLLREPERPRSAWSSGRKLWGSPCGGPPRSRDFRSWWPKAESAPRTTPSESSTWNAR